MALYLVQEILFILDFRISWHSITYKPLSSQETAIIKEGGHTQSDTGGNSGLPLLKKKMPRGIV